MTVDLTSHIMDCGLFEPGEHVVCAVSGGADSMALLWAMCQCAEQLEINVSAAHFNHNLRGAESDADEAFVRDFCAEHGIPCQVGSGDVAGFAEKNGMSIEQAARTLRYQIFDSLDCDKIATAHHANDNAETILMNLLCGTGLRGLCGIPRQRGRFVRPLLQATHEATVQYLALHGLPFREDSSNAADDALRNRIRHEFVPLFLRENPDWLNTVQVMAGQLQADEDTLRTQTELLLNAGRLEDGFSATVLCALPDGMRRRTLRQILEEQHIARPGHRHVELLEKLIFSDSPSAMICLPDGLIARRSYDSVQFDSGADQKWKPVVIDPHGITQIPELGLEIHCSPAEKQINSRTMFTIIPTGQIIARPRRTGDQIQMAGGRKSLKKLMIDRKIPRRMRELLPVLEDEQGLLAVYTIGADRQRMGLEGAITIKIKKMEDKAT